MAEETDSAAPHKLIRSVCDQLRSRRQPLFDFDIIDGFDEGMVRIDKRLSVCVEGDESSADGFDQERQAIAIESPTAHRSMPVDASGDYFL